MSISNELRSLAHHAGGSFKTRYDRINKATLWAAVFSTLNIQTRKVSDLHEKQIQQVIDYRKDSGIISRTLTNDMAAMRVILRKAGRHKLANSINISNKSLGISGGSREGKHRAMPDELFNTTYLTLESIDKGVAVCTSLAFHLGLRAQEAIQSNQSLKTWEKFLLLGRPIRVVFGTKGGRPRNVWVVDTEQALLAVRAGIVLLKTQKGRLVDRPNLKKAMNRYEYCMKLSGAIGEYSGHSLRCAFAVRRVDKYIDQGFTLNEALALTSMDLGHGDGRGAFVKLVYYRK